MSDEGIDVEVLNRLRAPFPPEAIGKLPRVICRACASRDARCDEHKKQVCRTCKALVGKHIHLDFVGHAHVTGRLLDVDPAWNWEPFAIDNAGLPALDSNGGLWIRLTICGVTRIGYGDAPGKRGGDAQKEVIGDAIRNAAMRFGVALPLWMKEPAGVVDDEPSRQVQRETLTPQQHANQLRTAIARFGRNNDRSIADIAGDFAQWSQGKSELNRADAETLQAYLNHIQSDADA